MFKNPGLLIKTLATTLFCLEVLFSFVYGFYYIITMYEINRIHIAIGILIIVLGFIGSWISSLFIYGFGELVHNSTILKNKIDEEN